MLDLLFPKDKLLLIGGIAAILNAIVRVAIVPVLLTPLIDRVFKQAQLEQLNEILILGFLLIIFGAIMLFIQDGSLASLAAKTSSKAKAIVFQNLLKRQVGELGSSSGGLTSRIINDLKDIEIYLQYGIGSLIAESVTVLGILLLLFKTDFGATLILFALIIPLVLVLRAIGDRLEQSSLKSQASTEELGNHFQEAFKHHSSIRAFFADKFIFGRFSKENKNLEKLMIKRGILASAQTPITQILAYIAIAILIYILSQKVITDRLSLGAMIGYLTLVTLTTTPAQLLPRAFALYKQALSANKRLNDLIIKEDAEKTSQFEVAGLEIVGLSHSYENNIVLEDINIDFGSKGLVAIVGESGAGKSSLLKILLSFIKTKTGLILTNNKDIKDLNEKSFREQISYVSQSTELLQASIKDNICLGRDYTEHEINQVLKELQLAKKIDSLEHGLEHKLLEDGEGISGGERQRIAIARAVISKPKILLLDEPTANLDRENSKLIISFLQKQAKKCLIIIVSHQADLLEFAEQIYELKDRKMSRLK